MAIEVISRHHPSATKTIVCKNCGAELRYTNVDTRTKVEVDYTGGRDTYKVIDCPDCRNTIYVS